MDRQREASSNDAQEGATEAQEMEMEDSLLKGTQDGDSIKEAEGDEGNEELDGEASERRKRKGKERKGRGKRANRNATEEERREGEQGDNEGEDEQDEGREEQEEEEEEVDTLLMDSDDRNEGYGDYDEYEEQEEEEEEEEWLDLGDELVPIRLDLFLDGVNFKDTFIWDITETAVTPEQFARTLCMEMDYSQQSEEAVAASIRKQLNAYRNWKKVFLEKEIRIPSSESLILIQLNLTVHDKSLQDQFEWDIKNQDISPESFAYSLCSDLGLSKEFEVSISHSIREQVNRHLQAVTENSLMREQWIRPIVIDAVRDEEELPLWTPSISSAAGALPPVFPRDRTQRFRNRDRSSGRLRTRLDDNPNSPLGSASVSSLSGVASPPMFTNGAGDDKDRAGYKFESRHKHAVSRPRGAHGRFLSKAELDRLGWNKEQDKEGSEEKPKEQETEKGESKA